jgi:anti-sigma regulatory factor (Ser/Thr protein kinase)
MVSELASNAVLHARSEFTVIVQREGDRLRVEVHDRGAGLPAIRTLPQMATTGRGLRIVDQLADLWGTQAEGDGKVVWFEVDLDERDEEAVG